MSNVKKAIAYIEEARESHVLWADILDGEKQRPKWAKHKSVDRLVGTASYHREWVRKYDHVLKMLRS